jgi:hypothetical protein
MRRQWRILSRVLQIAIGIVAVIQLAQWFAPNPVRLRVLVKEDEVQIPSAYREYLHALDRNRDALGRVHDAAAAAAKQEKSAFSLMPLENQLAAILGFSGSVPIFSSIDPHVIAVKIVNLGWKPATNVKVFFPNEGFVEIAKDGVMVSSAQKKGWIDLGVLEPSSQFIVTIWTTSWGIALRQDFRVVSDEGAANVRQWYVSRDENRWVIGFGPTEIVFTSLLAVCVCMLLLGLIANLLESPAESTAGAQKDTKTHATSSTDSGSS